MSTCRDMACVDINACRRQPYMQYMQIHTVLIKIIIHNTFLFSAFILFSSFFVGFKGTFIYSLYISNTEGKISMTERNFGCKFVKYKKILRAWEVFLIISPGPKYLPPSLFFGFKGTLFILCIQTWKAKYIDVKETLDTNIERKHIETIFDDIPRKYLEFSNDLWPNWLTCPWGTHSRLPLSTATVESLRQPAELARCVCPLPHGRCRQSSQDIPSHWNRNPFVMSHTDHLVSPSFIIKGHYYNCILKALFLFLLTYL